MDLSPKLTKHAASLRALPEISKESWVATKTTITAAWAAARAAARAAAGDAAWAAAGDAARAAAGAAAWDALRPTVVELQRSALGLLSAMIKVA